MIKFNGERFNRNLWISTFHVFILPWLVALVTKVISENVINNPAYNMVIFSLTMAFTPMIVACSMCLEFKKDTNEKPDLKIVP